MVRILTSGESHGRGLAVIVEGMPAGLSIDIEFINHELSRRQHGYGRGRRMSIEKDRVEIFSGVRYGKTLGSPINLSIVNKDYENWQDIMKVEPDEPKEKVTAPRPGHADLAGVLKYKMNDIRNVIERASARETAARVAAGALFKLFLKNFGINLHSHTVAIGNVSIIDKKKEYKELEESPLRCGDPKKENEMMTLIDQAKEKGDTLGGITELVGQGVCPGLGSYTHYDKRLDARIAQAMISIPSVKGVAIGNAFENTQKFGSDVHDEIIYEQEKSFHHTTNRAGGIEGGVSNGEDIVVRCAIKPIPTLRIPLHSVDLMTKEERYAQKERADICVVPAVGVIGEAMLALVICDAFLEKFGGDCLDDIRINFTSYMERIKNV
jgi:chorismate synthase